MPVDTDLPKLYRRAMNVWVEDALSSEYLNEVWREPRALFLIAGSTDSVRPVVAHAVENNAPNVFGVVDRDFENTNRDRWNNDSLRHFVLPVHEMENYLLDEQALADCDLNNLGKSAEEILLRMQSRAQELHLWMAVCHTLKRIRRRCLDDFVTRPSVTHIRTLDYGWQYIEQSDWYQSFNARAAEIGRNVRSWLDDAYSNLGKDLLNGAWKVSFSGKEIFRDARGFIYQPPQGAPQSVHDVDLAQSVGRWQADNRRVPGDLTELLDHVRAKAGVT